MLFSMLNLIAGRKHQFGALVLIRGETFIETIEEGGMALLNAVKAVSAVVIAGPPTHDRNGHREIGVVDRH